jgi:hypothetical protein
MESIDRHLMANLDTNERAALSAALLKVLDANI